MGVIEFIVVIDEGIVNRMLFLIRIWVVVELVVVIWWFSVLWEFEVCVMFEGCNKVEFVVDGFVCISVVGVVLLRCKFLYIFREKERSI